MKTNTAAVDRMLRKHVSPVLTAAGFTARNARNACRWSRALIDVFNVRAVGAQFSGVTGWPPGSLVLSLGVYWSFVPRPDANGLKHDEQGRIEPAEYQCHRRCSLERQEPDSRARSLQNAAERSRRDAWWIEPDASNAETAALSIAQLIERVALPWFERERDLRSIFSSIEQERDCLAKYERLMCLAGYLQMAKEQAHYTELFERECTRLGRPFNRVN